MSTNVTVDGQSAKPAKPRGIIAWSLWDWGSAAFNAVIVTFIFSVYLTDGVGDDIGGPFRAATWLGLATAVAAIFIILSAPGLGNRIDSGGTRKKSLFVLTLAVVVVSALMFFVQNDANYFWLGLLLLASGQVIFELASVPYFAMLRQVSTPDNVGKVSGIGWAFGYLGGIILLLICYFGFLPGGDEDELGLFGVTHENGLDIRLITVVCAVWFLLFAIPLFLRIPEAEHDDVTPAKKSSYREVWGELWALRKDDPVVFRYLVSSAVFRDGLAGVFAYGAVIAVSVYGISSSDVILFGVAANVLAAAGAIAAGFLDDALGPRIVIIGSLLAMLGAGIVLLFVSGPLMFWIFGLILCIFVGPAQSAARTFLTRLTEPGMEGRNFGMYAMTGRAASFLAPLGFAVFIALGNAVLDTDTDRWGIIGIMVVLIVGLGLLLRVPAKVEDRSLAKPERP